MIDHQSHRVKLIFAYLVITTCFAHKTLLLSWTDFFVLSCERMNKHLRALLGIKIIQQTFHVVLSYFSNKQVETKDKL